MPLFVSWAERKTDRIERIKQQQNIQLPLIHQGVYGMSPGIRNPMAPPVKFDH